MITAKDLNKLATESVRADVVERCIAAVVANCKRHAENGYFSDRTFPNPGSDTYLSKAEISAVQVGLEALGFSVDRDTNRQGSTVFVVSWGV